MRKVKQYTHRLFRYFDSLHADETRRLLPLSLLWLTTPVKANVLSK